MGALTAADLGVVMRAAGATVSSETADAVITLGRGDGLGDVLHTSRRALQMPARAF